MTNIYVQKLEPYKPPLSVWNLIESQVPPSELVLVKTYIGESSIEYCIDLRNELEILLDIWKEVGERVEPPTVSKNLVNSVLPDPPKLKEMLTKEIQLLVKEIQERNGSENENNYEDREKKVIQYAMLAQKSDKERPRTPFRKTAPEKLSSTSLKLKQVERNISATSIDGIADILREAIQKECKQLEADIEFLQKCVEEEHEVVSSRPTSPIEEPSVAQMRQVCRKLEVKALSQSRKSPTTSSSSRPTTAKLPTPPSPQRIQLEPIKTNNPATSKQPSASSWRRSTNFKSSDWEENLDLDDGTQNSWLEPSWAKCMSDSLPPSTGDSGVSSRPSTCEISARRERRKLLNSADDRSSLNIGTTPVNPPSTDVGYHTNTSTELTNSSVPDSPVVYSTGARTYAISLTPPNLSPSISPHPPKEGTVKISRKNVSARRFSRKLVKIS